MLSHQIILHPDTPFTSSFTPYERKVGFSWYLCPATVAGEQEWLLVNGEFGYVELVDTCDAEAIEQAVLDVIELHLPDGEDNVSVSFNPEHISWHTADKMPEHLALRYQQALKLLDISMVITLFATAQKVGRTSKTPGSVLSRHNLYKWLSFRSAATSLAAMWQRCQIRHRVAFEWL